MNSLNSLIPFTTSGSLVDCVDSASPTGSNLSLVQSTRFWASVMLSELAADRLLAFILIALACLC